MNVQEAIHHLKKQGQKHTAKREDILRLLFEEDRYLTAADVHTLLQVRYPGISFDTIYRNLALFRDSNIVEEAEWAGEKRFRFRCGTSHHHHHFICMSCGMTKSLHDCPMDRVDTDLPGYSIKGHKFEIYGYCNECS